MHSKHCLSSKAMEKNQLRFRGTIISPVLAISKIKLATNMSEGNACADRLANYGIHSNGFNWWNEAPSFILEE
ncbi:hypothetical protein Lal_00022236 [Lupinus albus]|nr:hypothetical protein Lal_00022236 [Lupinus albus]